MSRPLMRWSAEQLEAEFERAQDAGDIEAVQQLARELGHRTTPRARKLRDTVSQFLGGTANVSDDPTPTARRQETRQSATPKPDQAKVKPSRTNSGPRLSPTHEQQEAIDKFATGGSLKINAYAGTGKTSTLEMLAHTSPRQGLYIAFNRAIVQDARNRFPSSVNCSTIHGLAYKATPSKYKNKNDKMLKRINANQLADTLKFKRWQIDRKHVLTPRSQGYLVLETLRRFMQSADIELTAAHVPRHGSFVSAPEPTLKAAQDFALHAARHVWDRMKDENDPIPLGHDGYLKLWALSQPTLAADFILLDEAQDTNPVVLDVLKRQSAQMIYVGDKYQQIYEWRGAINAMEKIETDESSYLTTSFRFGARIANAASSILRLLHEQIPIQGNSSVDSRIGPVTPQTILARTNASAITAVIECLDAGMKPHLVGGTDELMEMLRGVQDLKAGKQSTVPDFFGFDKWEEVVEFAKSGEGDHLLTFVNLVESRGERQLMWALHQTVHAEKSNITISTAHKAKGQEWRTVRLMDDFLRSQPKRNGHDKRESNGHDPAELRLFYVALTRAKEAVEVPQAVLSLLTAR
ncbi:MAG: UvrD-helicase domain-containing protein [Rhizobiaceae bacterium]